VEWKQIGENVPFENGWHNFDTDPTEPGGVHWSAAAYMLDAEGWVHLKGTVAGGASGSTIATLPCGWGPPEQQGQATVSDDRSAEVILVPKPLYPLTGCATPPGIGIGPRVAVRAIAASTDRFSLDGIAWKASRSG